MSRRYSFALFFGICLVAFGSLMAWGADSDNDITFGSDGCKTTDCGPENMQELIAWQTVKSEGFGPAIGATESNAVITLTDHNTDIHNMTWSFGARYPESITLEDDGSYLYVVYRVPSNASYTIWPPRQVPDDVYLEVYGVEDGKIVYLGRQGAKVTPEKVINEVIEFEPFCPDGSCEE